MTVCENPIGPKADDRTHLACTCFEEVIFNSPYKLHQSRVVGVGHGTVVVIHWVDPVQTAGWTGEGLAH